MSKYRVTLAVVVDVEAETPSEAVRKARKVNPGELTVDAVEELVPQPPLLVPLERYTWFER